MGETPKAPRHSAAPSASSKPPREPVTPKPVVTELPQVPPPQGRGTQAAETLRVRGRAELCCESPSLASPPTGKGTGNGNDSLRRDVMLKNNSLSA